MMKISIKREQSQAGLSFAEREKFRPQVKNKLLLLLALLLTAATGAWATDVYLVGNGTGNWLNGVAWDPGVADNKMTEQNGVYSITFTNVDANSELLFKFAINGTWDVNYGCTSWDANELNKTLSNIEKFGNNFMFGLTETADVTISFNLSEMTYMISTKGMKVGDDAPAGYTVTMKDGVKDADKWTVKVGEGEAQALPIGGLTGDGSETVTLKYNGRLKVKGVKATSDAPAAKPAATVTTAPTGAAVVGVGKTTALVSGGAAEGGTMMYKVTTENTKPTSTDGFSESVPTAQTITASGKVYVWYYVKGDDSHSDSEIAATAIEVPVADVVWDATNVSDLEVPGDAESYTKEGIKLSCNAEDVNAVWYEDEDPTMNGISLRVQASGGFTFTAPTGKKFTKIEMNAVYSNGWDGANLGTGWKFVEDAPNNIYKATWTGSAASTVDLLKDVDDFGGEPVKSIAFYLSE